MTSKFRFEERIIDDKNINLFGKLFIKLNNFTLSGIEYALELLRRAKEKDYPENSVVDQRRNSID